MVRTESQEYFGQQHALVTGGGTGIGAAIASALASRGARLTLLGRDATRLEAQARRLNAATVSADVASRAAVDSALARARERHGPITILVNNAGAGESAPFHRTTQAVWDHLLAVNLTGVFNCTQGVIHDMTAARHGRIVNIASVAGLVGLKYVAAYGASKHGVVGLTRALAVEYAGTGITVNAVCPGYVDTELTDRSLDNIMRATGRSRDAARATVEAMNPQGRLIQAAEVAAAALWFCGPDAGAVTGQSLTIA